MTVEFIGIDLADVEGNRSRVDLVDDGSRLAIKKVSKDLGPPLDGSHLGAIDSPLGYPRAFADLIHALEITLGNERQYKFRLTDDVMGDQVAQLPGVVEANRLVGEFFLSQRHVHSPISLQIIPRALREALRLLGLEHSSPRDRLREVAAARLGSARLVETHPRLFLYSALERIRARRQMRLPQEILVAARDYKSSHREKAVSKNLKASYRGELLQFLASTASSWMGASQRELEVEGLSTRDHDFDAYLCALAAFMHLKGETWHWKELARLDKSVVEREGHIFILRPPTHGEALHD